MAGEPNEKPAGGVESAYRSDTDPRKRQEEGVVQDTAQAQNGSGFKGDGTRPEQNSDWYGVRRPDPSGAAASAADGKADPAHLAAAAATTTAAVKKPS